MDKFVQGKRYIFSRDKWLADTGNAILYQNCSWIKQQIDSIDGKEIEGFMYDYAFGRIGDISAARIYCDVIESERKSAFARAIDQFFTLDKQAIKQAMLVEEIDMLKAEKSWLEIRIKAVDKVLQKKEQELFELERGL